MASAQVQASPTEVSDWDTDIASIASRAAAELDNKLLGRNGQRPLVCLHKLSEILRSSVVNVANPAELSSSLNPTTTVLLRRSIPGGHEIDRLERLLAEARVLTDRLSATADAVTPDPSELIALRDFCLALSRQALAMRRSPLERPGHPFRH